MPSASTGRRGRVSDSRPRRRSSSRNCGRLGSRALTPDEAFTAWEHVHRHDIAQTVVVPSTADASTLSPANDPMGRQRSPGRRCPPPKWETSSPARSEPSSARELHTAESELDSDRPFVELGLNSMMALSIRREIERLVGLELSATMLWNHPTVATLAAHLAKKLAPEARNDGGRHRHAVRAGGQRLGHAVRPCRIDAHRYRDKGPMRTAFSRIAGMTAQQRAALADEFGKASRIAVAEPVAVVGIGCRFPGDVVGPESFWRLLGRRCGRDQRGAGGSVGCRCVLRSGSVGAGPDDDEVGWVRLGCGGVRCRFLRYHAARRRRRWIPSSGCCWR